MLSGVCDGFGCKLYMADTINSKDCYDHMPKTFTTTGTVVNTGNGGNVTLSAAIQLQAWNMYKGFYSQVRGDMVNKWICFHADTSDLYHAGIRQNDSLITQGFSLYFPYNNVQQAKNNGWTTWYPNECRRISCCEPEGFHEALQQPLRWVYQCLLKRVCSIPGNFMLIP